MTGVAWVLLVAATTAGVLLAVALAGDAHLAAENRRLRRENARLHAERTDAERTDAERIPRLVRDALRRGQRGGVA